MQLTLLNTDPKAEYATAWRTDVKEARCAAQLPSYPRVLLLLCLATFLLQAIAASLRVYVNPDGITYLCITDLLADGNLQKGLANFGVNTFLYMLVLFKRLGLDPFYAGVWWNTILSSLVVLPLFGWIRRMFDIRIAVVASLLYAFHPLVLSTGSAVMRDPMFWLFFNLTIYASWRAITEVRLRWFFLAGCSLTLAIHTRSEAWFLVIPILLWTLGRFWFASGYRVRLCFGTLLLLAIIPVSITAVNLTVLKASPQWGIFRPSHAQQLTILYQKTKTRLEEYRATKSDKVTPPATGKPNKNITKKPDPKPPAKKVAEKTSPPSFAMDGLRRALLRAVKSYSYLYGICALIGLCAWRGRRRFALHAMFLMAVPLFALVWYKSCSSDVSPRYFLPIVFISFPIITIGLLWVTQKLATQFSNANENDNEKTYPKKPLYCLTGVMIFTLIIGCFGTVWGTSRLEQKECELGKWILKNYGKNQRIYCVNRKSRIVGWYAKTKLHSALWYPIYGPNKNITSQHRLPALFHKTKPHLVLCWKNHRRPEEMPSLFETLEENNYYGYQVIETGVLDEFKPKVLVLVRKDSK